MTPKAWLFVLLACFVAFYAVSWMASLRRDLTPEAQAKRLRNGVIGVALGTIGGWMAGGGIQIVNNELVLGWPFQSANNGAAGAATLIAAIASGILIGVMYAELVLASPEGERGHGGPPKPIELGIGFVTNFFDTLGIGSYATTTAMFRFFKRHGRQLVDDRIIPGTLNVGHTPPTITQALIFIAIVAVDFSTLVYLLAASVLGAWLGAGVVARWPRRNIQIGMGLCLLGAAGLMTRTALNVSAAGGAALGLGGAKLGIGIAGNLMLGALMTLGIGLYAPALIMISLLGMDPRAAFPIMMGSCAFLMPIASARFIREKSYSLRQALGLGMAGVPAVIIAAFIVRALSLTYVRWLVVVVVLYTAISMLHAARIERNAAGGPAAA